MSLDPIRYAHRYIRREFFQSPKPSGPYVTTYAQPAEIVVALGRQSFAPNWEFSYHKRGEDLNLAQVVHADSVEFPNITWWQTHVRAWHDRETGLTQLKAHWEPEPTEFPDEHLNGTGFDGIRGMDNLMEALDRADVPYDSPR